MAKPIARSRAPIWTRPAPGTRQPRFTREQIAQAALAIADAEGFAAVSMRRVATALGAGTMTLYYYVKTKEDLITLMDDAVMAEVVVPVDQLPRGWRAGLTAVAHATRDAFLRHPWALSALQGARMGPNGIRHIEQSLSVVSDLAADMASRLRVLSVVDDYVFGYVLRTGELRAQPVDAKVVKLVARFFEEQFITGDLPHLKGMFAGQDIAAVLAQAVGWMTDDTRFESGLSALLDGLERQVGAKASAAGRAAARPRKGKPRRSAGA